VVVADSAVARVLLVKYLLIEPSASASVVVADRSVANREVL
jgi:hypothetical protein